MLGYTFVPRGCVLLDSIVPTTKLQPASRYQITPDQSTRATQHHGLQENIHITKL